MKKAPFLITLFCVCGNLLGQPTSTSKRFFSYGLQLGAVGWTGSFVEPDQGTIPMNRTSNRVVARLEPKRNGYGYTFSASSSLGLMAYYSKQTSTRDVWSIGVSAFLNRRSYTFSLPYTIQMNGNTVRYWHENDRYIALLPSVKYRWQNNLNENSRRQRYTVFGISAGPSAWHTNFGNAPGTGQREDYMDNGEGVRTEYLQAKSQNWLVMADIAQGFEKKSGASTMELGLSLFWMPDLVYSKRIEFYSGGTRLGGTRLDITGSMVLLSFRYLFNRAARGSSLADTAAPVKNDLYLSHVNNRALDVQHLMTVKQQQIDLYLWDNSEIDGDRVTVYLNGEPVLNDYVLQRGKKKVVLTLKRGSNYLSVHAEDLGKTPPVVTAMSLVKNGRPRMKIIRSDLQTSGAWKIIYK